MQRITILYIIDVFLEMAGAERNLFEVVTRLNPQRFKPIVMCLEGGRPLDFLRNKGVETTDLKLKRIYTPYAFLKAIEIFRIIKQYNVKIVITYHESSDFLGSVVAKLAGVPVIISSRRDMGYKLKKRHILIYKLINRLFNRIITVSDAVKNVICNRENAPLHKIVTIHNGVELEKFSKQLDRNTIKQSLGLRSNRPIIGILAGLRPIKGHKYFLEAASLILQKFPETYFLIVGWYDKNGDYFKELKALIRKLNIEENVIFIGGRSDIPEVLSIVDVPVFSSINEGFSNAVLEAMAVGKPVVATNSGGTSEAVIDGETGILVPPCNSEALASAVMVLLDNPEKAKNMGEEGKKRAKQLFSINKMIQSIENLYEKLLSETEKKR